MEGVIVERVSEYEIECLRNQLIQTAQQEGLHADCTILLSRKLDVLIDHYTKQKKWQEERKKLS